MALALESAQDDTTRRKSVRQVLSTVAEVRAAVVGMTRLAERSISILTHDLEPEIYDHDDFLEALKRFVLARPFARVRVLIAEPVSAMKDGNRFVSMGRRLNSYIELRNVKPEYRSRTDAFCIADDAAVVYRARRESWEGMSDTFQPQIARLYLDDFEQLWQACEIDPQLRRLQT